MPISSNMSMPIPVVGVTDGPQYATDLNSCLEIIDTHDHTPGYGVPITTDGLDINADLSMGDNNLIDIRSSRYSSQVSPIAEAQDLNCVYVSGVDLYYNDGDGNPIQITANGGVAGTPGSIANLVAPASAAWVAADDTFVWETSPAVAANMDAGTLIIRYPGSYPSPTGDHIAIRAPTTLSTAFNITLPDDLPIAADGILAASLGGALSYLYVDGDTIDVTGGELVVDPDGLVDGVTTQVVGDKIATKHIYMSHQWQLNGIYSDLSVPNTEVDGYLFFPYNATILAVWIYNTAAGSSGTTEFDIKKATASGGAFSTILSTTGKITSAAAAGVWTDDGSVIGAQAGVTKPVLSSTSVNAGDALRFDVITVMGGSPTDCGILIQYVPRN